MSLYEYKALLIPWGVRGLETFVSTGRTGSSAWHDGDTFNALVSRGGRDYWMVHVRCAGYDAPELSTGAAGARATEYARSLVEAGEIVHLNSLSFVGSDEQDSFGRMLAQVTLPDGRDLAELMTQL